MDNNITKKFNKWNELKQKINNKVETLSFKEREIYFMSIGQNIGAESYGKKDLYLRPVLVYKKLSKTTFIGIPLTSKLKDGSYYFSFNYTKDKTSIAMFNNIRTFDIKRANYRSGLIKFSDFKKLIFKLEEFMKITPSKREMEHASIMKLQKSLSKEIKLSVSDKNTFVNKNNKNILITGGAGFIGSNFLPYFLEKYDDYNLINLDILTYAGNLENLKECEDNPRYKFIKGDICNRELIELIFNEYDIKGVIHFAAESHVDNSIKNPEVFIQTNVNGTFTLIDVAYKYWMNKPFVYKDKYVDCRFHHISTDEVYGTLNEIDLFTESTPYAPNSPYSASKASSDMIVRSFYETFGLNIIITNCSNNYGPKQHNEKLIPTIIKKALKGDNIPIYGDGKNIRDWLYVLDHCIAIDLIYHNGKLGDMYNIGGRNERTNLQIVNTICDILEENRSQDLISQEKTQVNTNIKSYKELITFVEDRAGHDRRYAIDASKLEDELGWKANENFDTGIAKTVQWYLGHIND